MGRVAVEDAGAGGGDSLASDADLVGRKVVITTTFPGASDLRDWATQAWKASPVMGNREATLNIVAQL